MKKRAALYLRVSTDRQAIENQRPEVEQLARARGYEVVTVYEEQASAVKHRPEYTRMMMVVLDTTKNGRGGSWVLDPGTAEALRRWRKICPSQKYVFPTSALPRHRRSDEDKPLYVDHLANELRDGLRQAGVKRTQLFEVNKNRIRLRAHDLRASFTTLALASGKTEDWVVTRTDHRSSQMIALYRRQAKTAAELNLGWFKPLHEIIPELAALGDQSLAGLAGKTARTIESSDESSETTTPARWSH